MSIKHIIIAPDSFKESMTAKEAAQEIANGFRDVYASAIRIECIPMADGGEGTMQSLVEVLKADVYQKVVMDPLGEPILASYAISKDQSTAIIEMAEASGLERISPEKRDPLITTTYGTGELMKAALDHDIEKMILGIGGSATNDGGAGMIEALGATLHFNDHQTIKRGGAQLRYIKDIDLSCIDSRLKDIEIIVACDVDNPLLGSNGASAVFGPQKGADEVMIAILDDALCQYHQVLMDVTGKNVKDIPGAGAAGGLGASLLAVLNAELKRGIEIVLRETNFCEKVAKADLVITGEGKIDGQTSYGKVPVGVAKVAKKMGLHVIAFCGSLGEGYESVYEHGIDAVFSISERPECLESALENGPEYLRSLARNVAKVITMR